MDGEITAESRERQLTVNVDIEVPERVYEEAQYATEVWSAADTPESIRDYLFDRIEVSHTFLVDGEPLSED